MQSLTLPLSFSFKGYALFAKLAAFVKNELAIRAAVRELRRMDDRALADMGICRVEIEAAVRGFRAAK